MEKLRAYVEIIRPINSVMLGFSIIVGAAITGGTTILQTPVEIFLAFITGFTMTGAAMAVNDFYDKEIDAINEPQRPIPSGRMSGGEALGLTAILCITGLFSSYLVSREALVIASFALIVMLIYSAWGKRTGFLGNIMVSTCIGLPFIYGGFMTGRVWASFFFSLIAFLTNIGREITKGIVDIEGDERAGVNTIAVIKGDKTAALIASLFLVSATVASAVPVLLDQVSNWYIPFIIVTDLGLLISSYSLFKQPTRENSREIKNRILYLMLIGLIGFAAGSLI